MFCCNSKLGNISCLPTAVQKGRLFYYCNFFCHFNAYLPQVCSYHNSFSFFQLFYKGNNIYGEEISRILLKKPESRSQFILMDRIQPKLNTNILVRQDSAVSECTDVIPELGIVGIVVRYVPTYRADTILTWQAEVSFGD